MSESERDTTLVLEDVRDENGTMYRAVSLTTAGELVIEGQDLGKRVEGVFGCSEYEFIRRLSLDETEQLRRVFGLHAGEGLLATISQSFNSTSELESLLKQHGIAGKFWNRVGD